MTKRPHSEWVQRDVRYYATIPIPLILWDPAEPDHYPQGRGWLGAANLLDVSQGGMKVLNSRCLEVGQPVIVSCSMQYRFGMLNMPGEVCWSTQPEGGKIGGELPAGCVLGVALNQQIPLASLTRGLMKGWLDKRHYPRIDARLPVFVEGIPEGRNECQIANVSQGGLCLQAPDIHVARAEELCLRIQTPDELLRVPCAVRWHCEQRGQVRLGVEFLDNEGMKLWQFLNQGTIEETSASSESALPPPHKSRYLAADSVFGIDKQSLTSNHN